MSKQMADALIAGNVAEFERLLRAHPECLRHADGTDRWMWLAAMEGQLPIIKLLVSMGVGVDESQRPPEGTIVQAACYEESGDQELIERFQSLGVRLSVDPDRPNVALE